MTTISHSWHVNRHSELIATSAASSYVLRGAASNSVRTFFGDKVIRSGSSEVGAIVVLQLGSAHVGWAQLITEMWHASWSLNMSTNIEFYFLMKQLYIDRSLRWRTEYYGSKGFIALRHGVKTQARYSITSSPARISISEWVRSSSSCCGPCLTVSVFKWPAHHCERILQAIEPFELDLLNKPLFKRFSDVKLVTIYVNEEKLSMYRLAKCFPLRTL